MKHPTLHHKMHVCQVCGPKSKELSEPQTSDTPVRLLGYANEVGEAIRSLVHVNVVRLSYAVASAYVVVDTTDKVLKADKVKCPDAKAHCNKLFNTVGVHAVSLSAQALLEMPLKACKWTTTGVGLGCIPFTVSPIDHGVHALIGQTLRPWLHAKESSD
ncbi:hypothetical protein MRX96_010682 [Rhipicephalus microplus]